MTKIVIGSYELSRNMVCLAVLLIGLVLGPNASAQVREDRAVSEEISVRLVTLDVYVTDKKGRPVEGLTLEDFKIREEQTLVEVESFRAVHSSSSAAATGAMGNTGAETPLTVVIYLDEALLLPTDWARMKRPLTNFVEESVPEGTGLVLARFGEALEVMVPHTSVRERIVEGIGRIVPGNGGIGNLQSVDRAVDMILSTEAVFSGVRNQRVAATAGDRCTDTWTDAVAAGRAFASEAADRFAKSTESLARFVSSLSGIPGRKSVIYVNGGLQMQPGSEIFYALGDNCPDRQSEVASLIMEYQETSSLTGLAAHANANRVTMYPLDAAGVRSSADGSRSGFNTVTTLKDSQLLLARETGGRAILNAGDPTEALANLAPDFHKYYEITYRPNRVYRRPNYLVDVRLNSPGKRKVRYRRTVAPKTTEELLAERLFSTLVLGIEDNPLRAKLSLDVPKVVGRKLIRQPIRVAIPRSSLLVLDGETTPAEGLRLFLVARDLKNRGSDVREHILTGTEIAGDSEYLEYVVNLDLEPGTYKIAVGVRDERAKVTSFLLAMADLAMNAIEPGTSADSSAAPRGAK